MGIHEHITAADLRPVVAEVHADLKSAFADTRATIDRGIEAAGQAARSFMSDAALADSIGEADLAAKAAEERLAAFKGEFRARGLSVATGQRFAVTATEQIAGRLDTKAVKAFLGASASRFETAIVSTVIRVKPRLMA